jgi:hypothetical protein
MCLDRPQIIGIVSLSIRILYFSALRFNLDSFIQAIPLGALDFW